MKRLFILLLIFVAALSSFGQFSKIASELGNSNTLVPVPGALKSKIILETFADTTSANLTPIASYPNALIGTVTPDALWKRNSTAVKWTRLVLIGEDTVFVLDPLYILDSSNGKSYLGSTGGSDTSAIHKTGDETVRSGKKTFSDTVFFKNNQNATQAIFDYNVAYPLRFNPKTIAGLNAWYDAEYYNNYVLEDDTLVTTWKDRSDSARDITQGTTANKPILHHSGGPNDMPYLEFTSSKSLSKTGISAISQPYTVYMVVDQVSFTTNAAILQTGVDFTYGIAQKFIRSRNALTAVAGVDWSPSSTNAHQLNKWILVKVTFNGTESIVEVNDEPQDRQIGSPPGTGTITRITLNGDVKTIFNITEMLIYSRIIIGKEDEYLRRYLMTKYGIVQNNFIVFFGDSITEGSAASNTYTLSFPSLISIEKGYNFYNYGYSGAAIHKGPHSLLQESLNVNASYKGWICLAYGSNDNVQAGADSILWRITYKSILQRLINRGIDPAKIILATQPYSSNVSHVTSGPRARAIIQSLCTELGLNFADCWTATFNGGGDALLTDGTHPNDAGHRIIADTIEALIP